MEVCYEILNSEYLQVHCLMGISRSATVVCAYLVATASMQAHEAIDFVISKRSIVCPNLGFRYQLEDYATRFDAGVRKARTLSDHPKGRLANVSEGIAARIRMLRSRTSHVDKKHSPETSTKRSEV